jgi:hypothetical protein
MEVIMCMDCGQEWTHGAYPDEGGRMAHEHQQSTGHRVWTGDRQTLKEHREKGGSS